MEKMCFLFGHADAPQLIMPILEDIIEKEVENGMCVFCVGTHGRFDSLAATALKAVKRRHAEIVLLQLITGLPEKRELEIYEGFTGTYYPPVEGTPKKYALVRANQYMVETADRLICYVWHHGNTRKLLDFAQRAKKNECTVTNIAERIAGKE